MEFHNLRCARKSTGGLAVTKAFGGKVVKIPTLVPGVAPSRATGRTGSEASPSTRKRAQSPNSSPRRPRSTPQSKPSHPDTAQSTSSVHNASQASRPPKPSKSPKSKGEAPTAPASPPRTMSTATHASQCSQARWRVPNTMLEKPAAAPTLGQTRMQGIHEKPSALLVGFNVQDIIGDDSDGSSSDASENSEQNRPRPHWEQSASPSRRTKSRSRANNERGGGGTEDGEKFALPTNWRPENQPRVSLQAINERLGIKFDRSPDVSELGSSIHRRLANTAKNFARSRYVHAYVVESQDEKAVYETTTRLSLAEHHRALLNLLDGKGANGVELFYKYGPGELSVGLRATRKLPDDCPIAIESGILREVSQFNELCQGESSSKQLLSYGIDPELMAHLGYSGPELVVDVISHANETRYTADSSWGSLPFQRPPNAGMFLVFDCKLSVPRLVLFTVKEVQKGEEIVMNWGSQTWQSLAEVLLKNMAYSSWAAKIYRDRLLEIYRSSTGEPPAQPEGSDVVKRITKNTQNPIIYFDSDECQYLIDHDGEKGLTLGKRKFAMSHPATVHNAPTPFQVVSRQHAFETAGCIEVRHLVWHNLSDSCFEKLNESPKFVDEQCLQNCPESYIVFNRSPERLKRLYELMDGGNEYVDVVSIETLDHPVRALTCPDQEAFAVVANRDIPKDMPICIYWGRLMEADLYDAGDVWKAVYGYEMDGSVMPNNCRDVQFVICNRKEGGVARFINDYWGHKRNKSMINASAQCFYDKRPNREQMFRSPSSDGTFNTVSERRQHGNPVIVLMSTRLIRAGEEIVVEYGVDYWRVVLKSIMRQHAKYYLETKTHCDIMEEKLKASGVSYEIGNPAEDLEAPGLQRLGGTSFWAD